MLDFLLTNSYVIKQETSVEQQKHTHSSAAEEFVETVDIPIKPVANAKTRQVREKQDKTSIASLMATKEQLSGKELNNFLLATVEKLLQAKDKDGKLCVRIFLV